VPNPFSRIVSGAKISLRADALADKPDMAVLVSQIFAVWADIEFHLSLLLVQMLGADEHPAVAMYSTITSQIHAKPSGERRGSCRALRGRLPDFPRNGFRRRERESRVTNSSIGFGAFASKDRICWRSLIQKWSKLRTYVRGELRSKISELRAMKLNRMRSTSITWSGIQRPI
jgi:hypothetical protein